MSTGSPTIDFWLIRDGASRLHGLDDDDEALEILKLAEAYFGAEYADDIAESRQEIADTIARFGRVSRGYRSNASDKSPTERQDES